MGAHFGSIHVLTKDRDEVKRAVESIESKRTRKFLVAPPIDGWVTVFPENNGQDGSVAEELAEKLPNRAVLYTMVHDDDVFAYWYFENGVLKDRYNSCPKYFDDNNTEPRGGNAQAFAKFFKDAARILKLQSLLDAKSMTFEGNRLEQFARLLNLPNAASAYEYLQDGERDGIQKWKEFIHIPDLTAEREAKRSAKARAKSEFTRLKKDGLLILEKTGPATGHSLIPSSPTWCINPSGNEVLLAWTGSGLAKPATSPVIRINSQNGHESAIAVSVSSHAYSMTVDPAGKVLAVGCASGDWKLELWNIADGKLLAEVPQKRAVNAPCFNTHGDTLFSLSEGTLSVIRLSAPDKPDLLDLFGPAQAMVLHPKEEYLVEGIEGMLGLVHLPTLKLTKTVWIKDRPGPARRLIQKHGPQIAKRLESMLADHMSAEELAEHKARRARHFLPKQPVRSMIFTPSGNHLICGTSAGVCALEWKEILATADMASLKPAAFVAAEPMTREDGVPGNQLIYAVQVDAKKHRVLFSGLEGKIRFWDLKTGKTGDLLVPPVRHPFWRLELTSDRSSLVATTVHLNLRGPKDPPKFQIWSYPALCQAAGLEY